MFVILLQQTRIDLLLLDLTVDRVGPPLFHHHAGNPHVGIPDRKVRYGGLRWQRKQILAFKRLLCVAVEDLQHAHAGVLVIDKNIHFHRLQR